MTSKPTARERFDSIKGNVHKWLAYKEQTEFLLALVEAAISTYLAAREEYGEENHDGWQPWEDVIWQEINQRMAVREDANREGERKV